VRAVLSKDAVDFDIAPDGMLVWYGSRESTPLLYDLGDPVDELSPRTPGNLRPVPGPTLDAERVVFSRVPLTWPEWMAVWQRDQQAGPPPRFGPADWELTLLPRRPADPDAGPRPALLPEPPSPAPESLNGPLPGPSANGERHASTDEPEPNRVPPDDSPTI
jgi:hypothetical protein